MEFSFSCHGPKGRGLCTGSSTLTAHYGEHRRMNKKEFFFFLVCSQLRADFAEIDKTNTNTNIDGVKLLVIGSI